jgi:hypothetical protein
LIYPLIFLNYNFGLSNRNLNLHPGSITQVSTHFW